MKDTRVNHLQDLVEEAHTLAKTLYSEQPDDFNDVKDLSRLVRYLHWCGATTDRLVDR